MTIETYDVIVIGGGPAGGQASRNLAKRGHKVLLVERYQNFGQNDFSSAGMTLEPLKEFDLPNSIIGAYWTDLIIQCSQDSYHWKGEENKGVVLDFKKLRQFLADECVAHGGKVLMGHRYLKKEVTKEGVIVALLNTETSETIKVGAALVVDATGPLRKVMFDEKEEQPQMVLGSGTEYLIEVEQEVYDEYKNKLVFFLGHKWAIKGYSWIFPMENRILKVGAGKTHIKSKDQEKTNKTTRKITEKIIQEYIKTENFKILDKHGGILRYSAGLKDKFYHNKVIAVGDSVSAINPRGGEGIRYAMQTANLACKYIDEYLTKGSANFSNYRRTWRRKKLLKWRLSEFSGRRMYSRYSDEQIENRVKFFYQNFTIDDMVQSLFNFKYNKVVGRVFQLLALKISYFLKKEKF
ncbi:MAG: NAD(P)/FAD-dependent oxidoreductase [Flavobacteriaceae bacterium]|nr:NAD(P)/FAD-dependent oxidoreductase [Flavobacteriaceae bacterium]